MSVNQKRQNANSEHLTADNEGTPETEHLDPRVSELIGFADAARRSGFSYWTYHNARRRGRIRGVELPGGAIGLLRSDVASFDAEHRKRLAERQKKETRSA